MRIKQFLKEMETSADVGDNLIPMRMPAKVSIMSFLIPKPTKKKKKNKKVINENMETVKFYYKNWHNDKFPVCKILDYDYPGIEGQSTYGQRKDLLGWNLNYFENKEEAAKTIDDIDTFARMISANKEEKYKRIKYFFPEQASLIRRFNKEFVRGLRRKDGWYWTNTDYEELKKIDKEFS